MHVDVPAGAGQVQVTLNGKDVTSALTADGQGLTGLVGGMRLGSNTLRASSRRRPRDA